MSTKAVCLIVGLIVVLVVALLFKADVKARMKMPGIEFTIDATDRQSGQRH